MIETGGRLGSGGPSPAPSDDDPSLNLWYRLVVNPIMRLLGRMHRREHVHVLVPVMVSHPPQGIAAVLGGAPPLTGTTVLLRCDCGQGTGHLAEIVLHGRYTLDQVRGMPAWASDVEVTA